MIQDKFEDIRPYIDSEIVPVMKRISKHPLLDPILAYLFPDNEPNELRKQVSSIKSVEEFQGKIAVKLQRS